MRTDYDIAIIGSGFAGSLMALIARRLGRSVVLIEKGKHPRFAIGESSTPLANLLLDRLSKRYDLPALESLTKWGSWQQNHASIACGLKRGFSFYHHIEGRFFDSDPNHRNQLLVAASPRDAIADTHWYRPEFDQFLAQQAMHHGAELLENTAITEILTTPAGATLKASRNGAPVQIGAGLILDASGPRGCLHRALQLAETKPEHLPATQALYSHFTNVRSWADLHPDSEAPPYPPDAAAVHHLFDGGWIWMLRFNNGITSAGASVLEPLATEIGLSEGEPAWKRLLKKFPGVAAQFEGATPCVPFMHTPRLSFLSSKISGPSWAMLPSAAGFIDPLLSTGFPLTLLGIERLARILEQTAPGQAIRAELDCYSTRTKQELQTTGRLIAALYTSLHDFELFTAISKLYFAAASFAECAIRLDRPQLAGDSFLLMEHPEFGSKARECLDQALLKPAGACRAELLDRLHQTIQSVDVCGLGDASRRNWHPARGEDLVAAANKLGVTAGAIEKMLIACGFNPGKPGPCPSG
jgi:tetracycline 7-halogenase / FADH2 O2-dependent halogenase